MVFFAWGVFLLWRGPLKSATNILAIALVCAILPLGLWTARNYRTFGHLFFIRDAGMAIGSSDTDCAQAILADNLASGCFATVHPSANASILAQLRQQGEYQFGARQMGTAVQWARSHPVRFATLTLERIAYFWFPLERADNRALVNGIVMSLATVASFLSVFWRRSPGFVILAGGLSCYSVVYYLVQAEQRYRYPVFWMSVLLAAVGIELMLGRRAETKRLRRSKLASGQTHVRH